MSLIEIDPTKSVDLTSSPESLYSPTYPFASTNQAFEKVLTPPILRVIVVPAKSSLSSISATIWIFPDLVISTSLNSKAVLAVLIFPSNSSPLTTTVNVSIA
jgi:hypothetical protein